MADPQYREKGQSDQFYPGGAIEALPVCFALKAKLFDEVKDYQANLPPFKVEQDATGGVTNEQDWMQREFAGIRAVIQKERTCPDGFTQWQPYFTPKEHREMMDRQLRIEREDRRDREQRDWQEAQEEKQRQWQSKQQFRFVLLAGLFGLIAALLPSFVQVLQDIVKALFDLLKR